MTKKTLRDARESSNLTIQKLSNLIDVSPSSIRNWEKGRTTPNLDLYKLTKLKDALSISSYDKLIKILYNSKQN